MQDNEGLLSEEAVVTLNVTNLPLQIDDIERETQITEGTKTTFKAIASDLGQDPLTYIWNFGEDSETLIGQNISHTFSGNGIYTDICKELTRVLFCE